MTPTKLLYMEDFNLLKNPATVTATIVEDNRTVLFLDQTIFYPQGGGQPYDKGVIYGPNGRFVVSEVRFLDGVVKHIGSFEMGMFKQGDQVLCEVDAVRRQLHSRLHAGGHVIDMAVHALGLDWEPGKAYHFPEGPYVEYTGSLGEWTKDELKQKIEQETNKLIAAGAPVKLLFMSKDEMQHVCHSVPDYLPADKPSRVVMYGDFGIPCGGTHVNNIRDIGGIKVRSVKVSVARLGAAQPKQADGNLGEVDVRGDTIKVGYDVLR